MARKWPSLRTAISIFPNVAVIRVEKSTAAIYSNTKNGQHERVEQDKKNEILTNCYTTGKAPIYIDSKWIQIAF